jgi:hypothetical protein
VPHPCHPNPVSHGDHINKALVPRITPNFNPNAHMLPPVIAEGYHDMIFAMASDDGEESIQMTSNDSIVILDSGCSITISPDWTDFTELHPVQDVELKGISSGIAIKGIGIVIWKFADEHGNNCRHSVDVSLCPRCSSSTSSATAAFASI